MTVYRMLKASAETHSSRPAIRYRTGGFYCRITYSELLERVRLLQHGLKAHGIRRGDRVAILSYNRPEWVVCDLAIQSVGAVTVPIYHTLPPAQVSFHLQDSGAALVFAEDAAQARKATDATEPLTDPPSIYLMADPDCDAYASMDDLVALGRSATLNQSDLDAAEAAVSPDDVATFIYTSGTTGTPKAAMLSHRALLYTSEAVQQIARIDEQDVFLSFLPLCHVVERVGGYYLPLSCGSEIVYSEGAHSIAAEIAAVRPTVFLCVPRLYDTVRERVLDRIARQPAWRRAVARWALAQGELSARCTLQGGHLAPWQALGAAVAERLVLRSIRERTTGGNVRFLVSGGAPLSTSTGLFFEALGVCVLEGYGMTEFPVISLTRPDDRRPGSVGPALPGIEVQTTTTGELVARGPSRMAGYHQRPEATNDLIDHAGWLHTGDVGNISEDGRITITDRIKDIIVLANGKNVAPQPIEALLKQSPYIQEAVIYGDSQATLIALVVPALEQLRVWAKATGVDGIMDDQPLIEDTRARSLIKAEIDRLSTNLAEFERVRRFALVSRPFSIERDELTPTLKVRRRAVAERYADILANLAR